METESKSNEQNVYYVELNEKDRVELMNEDDYDDDDEEEEEEDASDGFFFDFKTSKKNKHRQFEKLIHCEEDETNGVEIVATHNGDVDSGQSKNRSDEYQVSSESLANDLRKAITNNNFDLVKHLYEIYGLDIDPNHVYQDNYWTPLMFAVSEANLKIARFLIDKGADPNYSDDSFTVLMCACGTRALMNYQSELVDVVDLLLQSGADLHLTDKFGIQLHCFYFLF